jgi:DNA repair exonuclease SbcCD ATPase subunit
MIVFKTLTFKNFLSTGNIPVTINLNSSKTTLIHGTNGSGKSTILDALTFALFNKPFRAIRLPQLINTQNKKGMLTEIVFTIGKNEFMVVRGAKPKVFEIWKNGERLLAKAADKDNQTHLEQNILKLTFKSFCQVVILGSASYTPFMQLPTVGRRECVEDFLDIKVFSLMSVMAKDRLRSLKDRQVELTGDLSNLCYKIDLQKDRIEELNNQSNFNIKEIKDSLEERHKKVDHLQSTIDRVREHEKQVIKLAQQELKTNPSKKLKELNNIVVKMQSKIDKINLDSKFYEDHDNCPVCKQDIEFAVKQLIISGNINEAKKLNDACVQASDQMESFQYLIRIGEQRQKHVQSLQNSVFQYQTEVNSHQREIATMDNKLCHLMQDTSSVDKELGKLEIMEEDQTDLKEKIFKIQEDIVEHNTVVDLLKDGGIKAQIVKKYLPVMNNCIRRHCTELDFPIHFVLDEEFNESVSSPMHQDFSYASFSEGQKARIDLALCFTWREIGKMKNSVHTNLLILDEVFSSSLDEVGKECLLTILRYKLEGTNVVVIDHTLNGGFKDKFDRCIEVNRIKGFSQYS